MPDPTTAPDPATAPPDTLAQLDAVIYGMDVMHRDGEVGTALLNYLFSVRKLRDYVSDSRYDATTSMAFTVAEKLSNELFNDFRNAGGHPNE